MECTGFSCNQPSAPLPLIDMENSLFRSRKSGGTHCIVTAGNKNSLRRSHCLIVGRLAHSLSLSLSLSFSVSRQKRLTLLLHLHLLISPHSLLVLLKIFANSCGGGDHIAKCANVVGGCLGVFKPKRLFVFRRQKNTS